VSDIVTRLRTWVHAVDAASASDLMDEAANLIELLKAVNAASHSGFMVLAGAVEGMSGEITRLRLLSANGDCPAQDNAARPDNDERLAALQALTDLDEELGLPSRTPAAHDTPSEGREQSGCTLTDAERAAIESAIWDYEQNDDDEDCARMVSTLERLLERME
jgi:hypothetical protein